MPDTVRTILVTGASSGIGKAAAEFLASRGHRVFAGARRIDAAAQGERITPVALDVTSDASVAAAVERVLLERSRIDALVNNAGGQFAARLSAISAKGWDAVVRNNLSGGFLVARECVNQWMLSDAAARPGGAIVNIVADMWGGMPGMGHSGAARAGMVNFTETAALEWAPVRVNAVAPGWIASSGLDRYPPEMAEKIRTMQTLVPLQRLGTESEVSAAIVFLLTPAAAFVSGACLRIDGAAPNAKRIWPEVGTGGSTPAFDGFHLATTPRVLRDA